jgi:hypothetical protein
MTSLKPGDGITLMRIFYLSGKIPENTVLNSYGPQFHQYQQIKQLPLTSNN